jgi:predicted TIM-barrel fold metal-dependent hydrolase
MAGFSHAFAMSALAETFAVKGCIDAHVHVWDHPSTRFPYGPNYRGPAPDPIRFPPETLLRIAQPAGVKRIVLVQMSYYGTDNSFMLEAMRSHPTLFSGIAIVDHLSSALKMELIRLSSLGIRGLRIQQGGASDDWLDSREMRSLWDLAAKTKLAICCLVNPRDLPKLNMMCAEFPETIVVIDHMARIGMDGLIHDRDVQMLCLLAKNAGVYVKISAFYALGKKRSPYGDLVPLVGTLHKAYGAQRLMWGSDSPFQVQFPYTYKSSLDFVQYSLPFLNVSEHAWLIRKTAEKLFF